MELFSRNDAMHVLRDFFWLNIYTTAYYLDLFSLHLLLLLKSSMGRVVNFDHKVFVSSTGCQLSIRL